MIGPFQNHSTNHRAPSPHLCPNQNTEHFEQGNQKGIRSFDHHSIAIAVTTHNLNLDVHHDEHDVADTGQNLTQ